MASTQVSSGRLCAAGLHPMEPQWDSCPYCENARRTKARTEAYPATSASSEDRETRAGGGSGGGRRETRAMPSGAPSGSGGQAGDMDTRRLMGFLVTYSWRSEGEYFPIREGKNYIGAGKVSSEVDHPPCHVMIKSDDKLSAEHALILCRYGEHGLYEIVDQKSSNGTFLNGKPVPISGKLLPNYAEIKTGSTEWTFVMIKPEEASGTTSSSP